MFFTKMQGTGNDYVYMDLFHQQAPRDPSKLAVKLSQPHFGIGADGLILISPSSRADAFMTMFNADGSQSAMCGNGIRCVAAYYYHKIQKKNPIFIETLSGIKKIQVNFASGQPVSYTVDMGQPLLLPEEIPVLSEKPQALSLDTGTRSFLFTCVNMGNPHAVTVVEEDLDTLPIETWGPILENDAHFPARCNIEWIQVLSKNKIRMRVWERGSGETLSCGTGTCASVVAGVLRGVIQRDTEVQVRGGTLRVLWDEESSHVFMTGEARFVFTGEWEEN